MTIDRKLVLVNDLALQVMPEVIRPAGQDRVFVAGKCLVRMTLAELALPGAEMVWTDFRHSASLAGLQRAVQAAGGLDRMVLAVDGDHGEGVFSVMCAVLTLLPSLRRRGAGRIELICTPGGAAASLVEFADRIRPGLARDRILVSLEIQERREDRAVAWGR
jgi:hypothetical protein